MSDYLRWFEFGHLPDDLHPVAGELMSLAYGLEELLPDGREKSAGMRKLLEAKDCFVRAAIEARDAKA